MATNELGVFLRGSFGPRIFDGGDFVKKRFRKATTSLLTAFLLMVILTFGVFTLVPVGFSAVESEGKPVGTRSGTTGGCEWTLDNNGVLTISGEGYMEDYWDDYVPITGEEGKSAPWGKNIRSVIIEDGVGSIGEDAFIGCTRLTSVTIGSNVERIGVSAFEGCTALTCVIIPDSVTEICDDAFCRCSSLTSVRLPDGVTNIGAEAFFNCIGIKSITIPDSVTRIYDYALGYSEDYGKTEDLIIYGFTYNEAYYYAKNNGFEFVSMGDSQNSMLPVSGITGECSWVLDKNGTLTVSGNGNMGSYYYGLDAVFPPWENYKHYISSGIIENGVKNIGGCTFGDCNYLSSVSIANSVIYIGNQAFYGCDNLKNVCIPNSVTNIGSMAFSICTSIEKISIPDSVTNIGYYAFSDCYELKSIAMPDSVTSIGENVFSDCSKDLQIICVPGSYAETYAINNGIKSCNYGFEYYILEDGTVEITNYYGNDLNVIIPDYIFTRPVTAIQKWLFANNTDIQSVTIPDTVSTIPRGAFYNCAELKTVTMGDNVTEIGESAFEKCLFLENINLSSSLTTIGDEAFYDCRRLKTLDLPATVTTIGEEAFTNCRSLQSLVIPEGVQKLGNDSSVGFGMFENCKSLSEITIPASVTSIQSNAFDGCANVTIRGKVNSYAESYAAANQLPFSKIDSEPVGDANGDGRITVSDVTVIQRFLADLQHFSAAQISLADTNGDGKVDINDATHLQKFLAEFEGIVLGKQS